MTPATRIRNSGLYARAAGLVSAHPQYVLLAAIALFGLFGMPATTWVTLTAAGLGMGMMLFLMASGMTLSFGLMSVLNLGHGALITVGAFVGATLITGLATGHWPLPGLAALDAAVPSAWLWRVGVFSLGLACALAVHIAAGAFRSRSGAGAWAALVAGSAISILAALILSAVSTAPGIAAAGFAASTAVGVAVALGLARLHPVGADRAWLFRALPGIATPAALVAGLHLSGAWHAFMTDLGLIVPALLAGLIVAGLVGYVFERLIIRPVYGDHLKQIMVTVGAAIIIGELLQAIWGPGQVPMSRPATLEGGLSLGNVTLETYRLFAGIIGLLIYWGVHRLIYGTRLGLLIRAGVEDREMVESMGYRIDLLFIAVFAGGAALAGLGGVMWGLYQSAVTVGLGQEMLVLIIIVIIIGGLGSLTGCLYAALMVGLLNNYTIYLFPKVALFSSIGLMVFVLMLRPQGLIPVIRSHP